MRGWCELAQRDKLLADMRANPRGDWTIGDVEVICRVHGISCKPPGGGSHYVLSHPTFTGHLTIPARRPIKPIYIRLLVEMVEGIAEA